MNKVPEKCSVSGIGTGNLKKNDEESIKGWNNKAKENPVKVPMVEEWWGEESAPVWVLDVGSSSQSG